VFQNQPNSGEQIIEGLSIVDEGLAIADEAVIE